MGHTSDAVAWSSIATKAGDQTSNPGHWFGRIVIDDAQAKRRFTHVSKARRGYLKSSWFTREVPSGRRRIMVRGRFQRVSLRRESALEAAQREFHEETGFTAEGPFLELGAIKQAGGKAVTVWAFEGDCDPQGMRSDLCRID